MDVTVVIPAHNAEAYVGRALNTVLSQTRAPVEVIVVDDGSRDTTPERVREVSDGRIRLLTRETGGAGGYAARNVGVDAARTAWIAFLDADDEWLPHHLETLSGLAEQFPDAGLLSSSWRVVGAERQQTGNHYLMRYGGAGSHELSLDQFLHRWSKGYAPAWTSAVCARRTALDRAGRFPEHRCTRGGDVDTWLRMMLSGSTLAYSPEVTAVYHRDVAESVTSRRPPQVSHCTGETVAAALNREQPIQRRLLLKRLANTHKKDPIRKKTRREGLHVSDLKGFHPLASPCFFGVALILALLPDQIVRAILTLRDRAVSMRGKS